jgi:hypothetical protein
MATSFRIRSDRASQVAEQCAKTIGPQRYYLHNGKQGGKDWSINRLTHNEYEVIINDDKLATLLMLKWS